MVYEKNTPPRPLPGFQETSWSWDAYGDLTERRFSVASLAQDSNPGLLDKEQLFSLHPEGLPAASSFQLQGDSSAMTPTTVQFA